MINRDAVRAQVREEIDNKAESFYQKAIREGELDSLVFAVSLFLFFLLLTGFNFYVTLEYIKDSKVFFLGLFASLAALYGAGYFLYQIVRISDEIRNPDSW